MKWDMIARKVGSSVTAIGGFTGALGQRRGTDLIIVGEQLVIVGTDFVPPADHPHFPFGYEVEPD